MSTNVPFNRPYLSGSEFDYIHQAFANGWVAGDGPFTKRAEGLLKGQLGAPGRVLLTTSCTHALEMAAVLLDLTPGDEVIVPSFTFVSSALAFVMQGAVPVFADIRPDTLNLNENIVEELITDRTRAIVPVHYGGVGCEMDAIMAIAERHGLAVIEDNAHGLYGKYRGRLLGTIGTLAAQSFHETKNISCGEGGALVINDDAYLHRAEIIREKGTDRASFFRGEVDKYSWVDKGSSYVMSDMLAAFLCAQLEDAVQIQHKRAQIWSRYKEGLDAWARANDVRLPEVPVHCSQSHHLFYLLMPSPAARTRFLERMRNRGLHAVFHYLPLHDSKMGLKCGRAPLGCPVTSDISQRLVRLPFFNDMDVDTQERVIRGVVDSL